MPSPHSYGATILEAKGVTRVLGGHVILRDLNLAVRDIHRPDTVTGQVLGLLGPSGVGKTVLFKILAGLDLPDAGTVTVGEAQVPVQRGMVGVVAQHYPLFEHRTVHGNLVVAGRRAGLAGTQARRRADDFLERFGLADRGRFFPAQLSGGQRQRVAIAQQFMCSEHFLLLDEPFSGLDPVASDRVCQLITEVAGLHTLNTIIVVTHDVAAAIAVADTLWLMGRERDAADHVIAGARIVGAYDLIERGLAWRRSITATKEFHELLTEIRGRFPRL